MQKKPSSNQVKSYYDNLYRNKSVWMAPWNKKILSYFSKVTNNKTATVLEVGCGKGDLLYHLKKLGFVEKNLYGFDLSSTGVAQAKKLMPKGHFTTESLYKFPTKQQFDYIILAEVVEHLEDFHTGIDILAKLLKKNGELVLSFPNYFNLPWLVVRLLSEALNKPNWIVLQPIDRIYTYKYIVDEMNKRKLRLRFTTGTVYLPPLLFTHETEEFHKLMDMLKLRFLAFHPILSFRK